FGRTGAVTAQSGDYTADQITETATRKFASPDEKAVWNAKQDALISGTTIRTLFGQSLLGSGDISLTPAQMGVAAAGHTHTTADITDYTQKTKQLIHSSLEAGAGVTLSYNPANEKTIISAVGGSGNGGSGYIVADRQGATAGQNHAFSISPQNTFNLAAYALKEEVGAANQTYVVDDFGVSSEVTYNKTNKIIFDGSLKSYTSDVITLDSNGDFYSKDIIADGKRLSVSVVKEAIHFDEYIMPVMTSNDTPTGYIVSASSEYSSRYAPFYAFNRQTIPTNGEDCWATASRVTKANPQWLRVDLPVKTEISGYQIINRLNSLANSPITWKFQGSNNGNTWDDLDDVVDNKDVGLGQDRIYMLKNNVSYEMYRIFVTDSNNDNPWLTIGQFNLFNFKGKFIFKTKGGNYGASNGVLVSVPGELTNDKIDIYGTMNSGLLDAAILELTSPISILSKDSISVKVNYTPYSQIVISKSLLSASAGLWAQINAATLTATQTGNGKVRVAVTRDLVNWHVLRNGAWVDVGELSADTTGAEALIADGMTPAEIGGITAAQWTQLFSSNNGVPDALAFAFALDITDPAADVATIDRLVLNVNDASSWKVQSPAEVEIRWRTDSVTFRTATAGNYKLAYQVP
ncbi:discoidin domain-containing protein, partial [Pectobacterium odoriferum]|uniref:discoidin domain-containing protein n=1 Tax=Pectobacterium odoriferum TaxID=78398 RepID=UPI000CD23976